jgi:serine/threonine protein kinase
MATESKSSLQDMGKNIHAMDRSIWPNIQESSGESSPLLSTSASSIAMESSIPEPVCSNGEADKLNVPDRRPRLRRFRSDGAIKRGKWSTGAKIGLGSFGVVRIGMNRKTGTLMAVKSIVVGPAVMKDIQTEIDLLKSLDHINIVRYLGAETDGTHLHIFQEWVPGGSVTSLLHKFGPFSIQVVRSYLFQILSGLAYLHDNNILHRDIKGGNVLVNDAGIVKLADFGSSKRLAQHQLDAMENLTMRGTPYFMAPEVFEEKYGSKADIWSVGCVAFQMATGSPPWKGMGYTNPMSLFLHIKDSEGLPNFDWPSFNQEAFAHFKALLNKCFYRDPMGRPSARDLFNEAFFTAEVSSSEDNESRGLFSPGEQSHSTWGSTHSPKPMASRLGSVSFLSPPLPNRIDQGALRQEIVSPLPPSPVVDASEWPSWARERLECRKKSPYKRPPSSSSRMDSLAYSDDSSVVVNPFRRQTSGESSVSSSLFGLKFLEGDTLSEM